MNDKDLNSNNQYPDSVKKLKEPFHWELGILLSQNPHDENCVMALTERKSRFTHFFRLRSLDPKIIMLTIYQEILNRDIKIKSLTVGKGDEFSFLPSLAKELQFTLYGSLPQFPFQRSINQHAKGLFRRKFPQSTNFKDVSDQEIQKTQEKINAMPREILNWKSAQEVLNSFEA